MILRLNEEIRRLGEEVRGKESRRDGDNEEVRRLRREIEEILEKGKKDKVKIIDLEEEI